MMKARLYHGSNSIFDTFDMDMHGTNGGKKGYVYFTTSKENAAFYGRNIADVELSIDNPILFTGIPVWYAIEQYERNGLHGRFDCIVVKGIVDGSVMSDIYVITDPTKARILKWKETDMTEAREQFMDFVGMVSDIETKRTIMEAYDLVFSEDEFTRLMDEYARRMDERIGNKIPGGLGDARYPGSVDRNQLEKGVKVEMEHTNDPFIAMEIAIDHLTEIPDYYDRLEIMEKEAESR